MPCSLLCFENMAFFGVLVLFFGDSIVCICRRFLEFSFAYINAYNFDYVSIVGVFWGLGMDVLLVDIIYLTTFF